MTGNSVHSVNVKLTRQFNQRMALEVLASSRVARQRRRSSFYSNLGNHAGVVFLKNRVHLKVTL